MNRRAKLKELVKEMEGHADDARLYYAVDITAGDLRSWLDAIPEEGPNAEFNRVVREVIEDRRRFIRQAAIALRATLVPQYNAPRGLDEPMPLGERLAQDAVLEAIELWNELQKAGV